MRTATLTVIFLSLSVLVACEEETTTEAGAAAAAPPPKQKAKKVEVVAEAPPKVEFQEIDFTETERSRDPFRSFEKMFEEEAKTRVRSQREVLLDEYSVDELKLIGIVSRIHPARAMLVDPHGTGHVVSRGQFVGRAEVVAGGTSGASYEINWRVDRVRDSDIVLVREDPANPDVPSAPRVIVLHPEDTVAQR